MRATDSLALRSQVMTGAGACATVRSLAPMIRMATDTDLLERVESTDPADSTETARDAIEATIGERITDG